MAADMPVLDHCLGGQLMAKACGARVSENPIKEIGWGPATVTDSEVAKHWFADIERFNPFHWHGETFDLPVGANHLLASAHCQNQAYAMGKHLAMQCHIEMTPDMIKSWCDKDQQELLEAKLSLAVQQADGMQENLPLHCFFCRKWPGSFMGSGLRACCNVLRQYVKIEQTYKRNSLCLVTP